MSAVYLGRQISLQRKVAIKVLKKLVMEDKSLAERFVDEAQTVASLDHPHIISIYEAKKLPSGLAYFTMPYLTHGDFGEIICTNSDHLIELLCQICDGLAHAHKHGIIHRDLKPENILFDQFGRIKIADFGIAISVNSERKTKESQLLGSAHYMSPEQIQSRGIGRHSDIYSLGCIIYEKLTGDHVFQAGNDFSILMSHINKPIPELPEVLQEWQPIINQCLAKDPAGRFDNAEALKDALLAIKYSKQPVSVVPVEEPKATSKYKMAYVASGLAALVLMVLATIFITKMSSEKAAAEAQKVLTEQLLADQQATALQIKQDQEAAAAALALIATAAEQTDATEAEMIDLSGNLGNETINHMSVEVKLEEAQQLLKQFRLTKPKGDNAADKFQAILLEQPENQAAQQGLNQVGQYYFNLIERKLTDQELDDALTHVKSVTEYMDEYNIDRSLFDSPISNLISTTQDLVTTAVNSRRKNAAAQSYLQMAELLKPKYALLTDLHKAYNNIPQTGDLVNDKLQHQFTFFAAGNKTGLQDFMFGTNEVTVEQFARFAGEQFTDEKCHHFDKKVFFKKTWLKPPFDQNSQHPVVCINANMAQQYASWLSQQTGHNYRLPTAAEYQFIQQQLPSEVSCQNANLAGSEIAGEKKATAQKYSCDDGQIFTAPIKTYPAQQNVYNLMGNVSEWVTDCGNQATCAIGTSWRSGSDARNNTPLATDPSETHSHIGFRLVRTL